MPSSCYYFPHELSCSINDFTDYIPYLLADGLVSQINLLSDQEARLGSQLDFDCNRILDKQHKQIAFFLTFPNVSIV